MLWQTIANLRQFLSKEFIVFADTNIEPTSNANYVYDLRRVGCRIQQRVQV